MKKTPIHGAAKEELMAEFGTILEEISKDVKTALEGYGFLSNQIKDVRTDLTEQIQDVRTDLTGQIEGVRVEMNERFEQVDKRFEQVDKHFEQVDKRFEQIEMSLKEMREEICDIRSEMNIMKENGTDNIELTQFSALEIRVSKIEQMLERKRITA